MKTLTMPTEPSPAPLFCGFAAALSCVALTALSACSKYSLLATGASARSAPSSPVELLVDQPVPLRWDVAILADPQLHNYLGGPIRSMSPSAARSLTRVARRPAVLNVLGQVVLDTFITHLRAALDDTRHPLIMTLGDAANVSCTGEFDRFIDSMDHKLGTGAWLALHGNHDSFLSGNLSAYQRAGAWRTTWPTDQSILPRETRWSPAESAGFAYPSTDGSFGRATSWAQACADPSERSAPMTKGVWARRYLMALERQGVLLKVAPDTEAPALDDASANPGTRGQTPFNVANCHVPFQFAGTAAKPSPLGARGFHLSGVWHPRAQAWGSAWKESAEERCPDGGPLPRPDEAQEWAGFIVQSVEIGPGVIAILIDTSVREKAVSTRDYAIRPRFPGIKGFLGRPQIDHIQRHVRAAAGRKIVFVGHHPWKDLYADDHAALLDAKPVLYISGHTHFETSLALHGEDSDGLPELNVASVTDWPMEAALVSANQEKVLWQVVGLHAPTEGNLGCGRAENPKFYRPLLPDPGDVDCAGLTDDLGVRRGWREHQVERSERALAWIASRWDPPFPVAPRPASWRARANEVQTAISARIVSASREHPAQQTRGAMLARCAARAVAAGWRAPLEATCARRTDQVLTAAAVAGIKLP